MFSDFKKFVFLGSSGRIGALLKAVWAEPETTGLSLVWQYRSGVKNDEHLLLWPNLTDPSPLNEYQKHYGPIEGMFVFCGVTPAGKSRTQSPVVMEDNVTMVVDALNAASQAGIQRVIVASSSAVYGTGDGYAFSETSELSPAAPYGAAKRDMEAICVELARSLKLDVCFLRIGNVVGADSLLGNEARRSSPITLDIYPDGHGPRRSYIGVETFTRVLTSLALTPESLLTVLNIGMTPALTMEALLEASGLAWTPNVVAHHPSQNITLDCSELKKIYPLEKAEAHDLIAQWRSAQACS